MNPIPFQVFGINLLVRLMPEPPADVRVHCPKGSPIRYGEVVGRGDGFDEGANAFREMPPIRSIVAFEENPEEVEGHYFYIGGEEHRVIRLDAGILSFPLASRGAWGLPPPRLSPSRKALDAVLARIDGEEVVELTRALVRIPSVYRPDDPGAT